MEHQPKCELSETILSSRLGAELTPFVNIAQIPHNKFLGAKRYYSLGRPDFECGVQIKGTFDGHC